MIVFLEDWQSRGFRTHNLRKTVSDTWSESRLNVATENLEIILSRVDVLDDVDWDVLRSERRIRS